MKLDGARYSGARVNTHQNKNHLKGEVMKKTPIFLSFSS
jgi:hypothetical protein